MGFRCALVEVDTQLNTKYFAFFNVVRLQLKQKKKSLKQYEHMHLRIYKYKNCILIPFPN